MTKSQPCIYSTSSDDRTSHLFRWSVHESCHAAEGMMAREMFQSIWVDLLVHHIAVPCNMEQANMTLISTILCSSGIYTVSSACMYSCPRLKRRQYPDNSSTSCSMYYIGTAMQLSTVLLTAGLKSWSPQSR